MEGGNICMQYRADKTQLPTYLTVEGVGAPAVLGGA